MIGTERDDFLRVQPQMCTYIYIYTLRQKISFHVGILLLYKDEQSESLL